MNGHVVYGQALFDSGRYEQAETTFTTALSLDPENLIALRHLGDISRLSGNGGAALDWYKRVLDADPRNDEILGFIDALQAEAAAPPPAPSNPTPVSTRRVTTPSPAVAVEQVMPSEASTVEFAPPRTTAAQPTPIAPLEPVPPPPRVSEPKKRASMSLIDLDIDMGMGETAAPEPIPPAPAAPEMGAGDLDISGGLDFGDAPPEAETPSLESTAPAAPDLNLDSSLGWDMGGNVELPAEDSAIQEPGTGPRPAVFVTETMAELYLQQGFRAEALKVYKQLAAQNPDDASLRERVEMLEDGGRSSMSFEKLADAEPDFAPGTDGLVPINEPAPVNQFADEPSLESSMDLGAAAPLDDGMLSFSDAPTPVAAIPEVPVESLDFDDAATMPPPVAAFDDASTVTAQPHAQESSIEGLEPMEFSAPGESAPALSDVYSIEPERSEVAPEPIAGATPEPIAELTSEPVVAAASAPFRSPTPTGRSARSFFASLAQRRALRPDGTLPKGMPAIAEAAPPAPPQGGGSLDALFGAAPDAADEAMGQALMTAVGLVEASAPIRGRPTQAAGSELSLDSVFRSESPLRTSGPIARQSQVLKFDQFFDTAAPLPPDGAAAPDAPDGTAAPADDAQFQAWLQQLKGQ
jgi:tetratricopeptide (TPR) repeat protein